MRVQELESRLDQFNDHISSEVLMIPTQNTIYKIKRSNKQIEYPIDKDQLPSYQFITLTFDPSKFGLQPMEQQRKDYILYHIMNLYKKQLIHNFYGSFEYHKSGLVHAHLIAQLYDKNTVYNYLQSKFTNNNKNKIAIRMDPAKIPNAIDYINKESTDYFIRLRPKAKTINIIYETDSETESSENPLDVIINN